MSEISQTENFEPKKVTRQQIIEAAFKFVGLPYRTQGREATGEYRGTDCGGLVLLIGRELGISDLEVLGYSSAPDGETFEMLLRNNMFEIPKEELKPGDVIGCDYGDGVQHTVLVTQIQPRIEVIHAKRGRGVIKQYLNGKDLRGWKMTLRFKSLEENDA